MSDIAIYDHDTDIKEVKDYILRHGRRTDPGSAAPRRAGGAAPQPKSRAACLAANKSRSRRRIRRLLQAIIGEPFPPGSFTRTQGFLFIICPTFPNRRVCDQRPVLSGVGSEMPFGKSTDSFVGGFPNLKEPVKRQALFP